MIIDQFKQAILNAGLPAPDEIITDGKIHRFSTNGKRTDKSGWYVLHMDESPAGAFGCWRSGIGKPWSSKSKEQMSSAERAAHTQRMKEFKAQRDAEEQLQQEQAALVAEYRWSVAQKADTHPYLQAKKVQAYGLKVRSDRLLVPLRDIKGKLWCLQTILAKSLQDGPNKFFMKGASVKGCFFSIGKAGRIVLLCEGYATGASLHEATGLPVVFVMNSGNLMAVAIALHAKYPEMCIVVAADDDWSNETNVGMIKAKEAALAVGGLLAVPKFAGQRGERDTDFNDLAVKEGLVAVKACIDAAEPVSSGGAPVASWRTPDPLPAELPPVAPFDSELLPESVRPFVLDVSERMQCPPDFVAVGLMAAISSLIGTRAAIRPKKLDSWQEHPIVWGMIAGKPGVMKSPALKAVLKFLEKLESSAREQWEKQHESWHVEAQLADLMDDANQKEARKKVKVDREAARELLRPTSRDKEPVRRRYLVNDATVEKLADLLTAEVNEHGVMVFRDELNGLLRDMDKAGQEGARGFYLTGYDGSQGYAVDRIGRGESFIKRVALSLLGGIQPGMVQSYVRDAIGGGTGADGLLQRFGLAVWPDVPKQWKKVDRSPDAEASKVVEVLFDRLNQLQPEGENEPQVWRFDDEAQDIYWEWSEQLEMEIRGDELHPALESHLAKYRKLIPVLALIFAMIDTPDSGRVIHARELLRALAWCEYLRAHAVRLYAAAESPGIAAAHLLLKKIKVGKLANKFTPREVAAKCWTGLGKSDSVREAAQVLVEHGWLKPDASKPGGSGGRPSEFFLIHPSL